MIPRFPHDPPPPRLPRWLLAWGLSWLLLLLALAAFASLFGVPALLIRYEGVSWYGSPVWTHCHYLGPLGMVEARPGYDVYEECPGLVLLNWRLALLGEGRE